MTKRAALAVALAGAAALALPAAPAHAHCHENLGMFYECMKDWAYGLSGGLPCIERGRVVICVDDII